MKQLPILLDVFKLLRTRELLIGIIEVTSIINPSRIYISCQILSSLWGVVARGDGIYSGHLVEETPRLFFGRIIGIQIHWMSLSWLW